MLLQDDASTESFSPDSSVSSDQESGKQMALSEAPTSSTSFNLTSSGRGGDGLQYPVKVAQVSSLTHDFFLHVCPL